MRRTVLTVFLLSLSLAAIGCVEPAGPTESESTFVQIEQELSCAPIEYCPDAAEVEAECALEGRDAPAVRQARDGFFNQS